MKTDRRKTHTQRLSWWPGHKIEPGHAWCRIDLLNARISTKPTCKRCQRADKAIVDLLGIFKTKP